MSTTIARHISRLRRQFPGIVVVVDTGTSGIIFDGEKRVINRQDIEPAKLAFVKAGRKVAVVEQVVA